MTVSSNCKYLKLSRSECGRRVQIIAPRLLSIGGYTLFFLSPTGQSHCSHWLYGKNLQYQYKMSLSHHCVFSSFSPFISAQGPYSCKRSDLGFMVFMPQWQPEQDIDFRLLLSITFMWTGRLSKASTERLKIWTILIQGRRSSLWWLHKTQSTNLQYQTMVAKGYGDLSKHFIWKY